MLARHGLIASLALGALLAASPARAQDRTLDAFVADVLARNPSVTARALRRDAFRSEAIAASALPDPSIAVMVDRVPKGDEMPMVRYQLSQMVPWPGKLSLMREAVERQGDAAEADIERRRVELRFEAKRAYFMLLGNRKRREVNRAGRNLAATVAAAALGRYGAGMGGHHEVARAQVEVAALDVQLIDLDGERASTVAMMNALRDRPIETPVPEPADVASPAPPASLSALVERAAAHRPELREMGAMRKEATAMADLARKEPYPDLMASVWFNQMMGGANTMGVMLGATIPVFGVSKQRRRAAAFDARADGALEDQKAMRAMIGFEVSDAMTRYETATRQLELIRTVALPRAHESFDAVLAAYGAGTTDVVGVLDARRSLQSAELALADAMVAREEALASLEHAVGEPLKGVSP